MHAAETIGDGGHSLRNNTQWRVLSIPGLEQYCKWTPGPNELRQFDSKYRI
jgi:hypothetical protein